MSALVLNPQTTTVRPMVEADSRAVLRLLDTARRIDLRLPAASLPTRIKTGLALVAEDNVGLRGFMLLEPQPPDTALVVAAGLRDTWGVRPYLAALLPKVEQAARAVGLSSLAYIGYETWLVEELLVSGFETQEWIVHFERFGDWPKPMPAMPAQVRPAHFNDLPAILTLDSLAFDHIWRKSPGVFNEALGHALSFMVAEINGLMVGYEWCEIYRHHAHLARLGVHPGYQGRSIGAQLLYQAIVDTLSRGVNLITLNTQEINYRSHALYERFGFVQTGRRTPVLCKQF